MRQQPARKPRLLIILNRFVIGGQAVDTIPLAWHLSKDFDILILYGEKEKDELEPAFLLDKYSGLSLKKIPHLKRSINPIDDIVAFFSLLLTIRKFKADIVHTHGAKSGFLGRIAAYVSRVPVIIHTFHGHFFHSYFSKRISKFIAGVERTIGRITTSAVALSARQKVDLCEDYKIMPPEKIRIIPLGFVFDQENDTDKLRQSFRSRYNLSEKDVAIGIVGRIVAVKNHSLFIDVIKRVLRSEVADRAAFFIIGDGDLRNEVEAGLNKNNIPFSGTGISPDNRVVLTSWLTDMYEVMNGLDVVALTSLNEGTPLSVIEAQFFKRPVVSTDVGGVKDTMVNNLTGFLVPVDDAEGFAAKVALLIQNDEQRRRMGEAGYRFASDRFSKQKEIDNTKAFYHSLLS